MPISKHCYPRSLVLKNGTEVHLRPLDPEQDDQNLLDFFTSLPEKDRWYLENEVTDPAIVRHYLLQYNPKRLLPILAIAEDGRIVGRAALYRYPSPGARGHVGRLRVMVAPNYRNQRLGTFLLLDIIQLAVNLGLKLLIAEFIKGVEDSAIRAARKLDFFEQAVLPDYAKDPRGNNYDLAIMVKRLHPDFDDF